ncbi:MAG: bifunctional histidinol-phosphatase/imidazoleglycerol-phosphate dehydratase HisB [Bacteroidales bacterium]|jgi:imidazoleglycerol-phosphate dehydratase/histidinol-phosphatase|nr:bifunctional histidinol-phosphatase/imidazoleglycerol-phosphate dehydratase HisB [Bacteroidales bacterium]
MKKILFLDRDGTLIKEPDNEQVDSLDKLEFIPGVFRALYQLTHQFDYDLVMVTNQDGLGTRKYPIKSFQAVQDKVLKTLEGEGILFRDILIDCSFAEDNKPTRKPGIRMVEKYMNENLDYDKSFVIGDRQTDIQLARNMGIQGILLEETSEEKTGNQEKEFSANTWEGIVKIIQTNNRSSEVTRNTEETQITIKLTLEGEGQTEVSTGLRFFDHMLEQLGKHSGINLSVKVTGDLDIDEHHTLEDTALALGEAFLKTLGNKKGIERYGFVLPMDDCLAQVALDFGGRPWLVWDAPFYREKIGDMPTEMFYHFFKSFTDTAKCNLNIKASGNNEHHKIESIFKALGRALKMAVKQEQYSYSLPSTKGVL